MKTSKTDTDGFSLMELMIAMAVLAILVTIAYPSYTNFLLKGKRAEGRAALVELMQQQERYMTQNNKYLFFTTNTSGVTDPTSVPFKTFSGDSSPKASYFLQSGECEDNPNPRDCVKLVADPVKDDPEADKLELYSTGQKTCTGSKKPTVCWN